MAGLKARRPFEIVFLGVVGQTRTMDPLVRQMAADVWGAGADFRWKLLPAVDIAGGVYSGQALGTYSGAVLQTVNLELLTPANLTFEGIRSTVGWVETYAYFSPRLHSHVGYRVDDPLDRLGRPRPDPAGVR